MVFTMKLFSHIGMLVPVLALVAGAGCSKSDKDDSNSDNNEEVSVSDVAGMSKETLLVLKFHHES